MDSREIRLECCRLAVESGAHPEVVVKIAREMERFVLAEVQTGQISGMVGGSRQPPHNEPGIRLSA
jgi:hypothetical protein